MDFGVIHDSPVDTLERPIVPAGVRMMSILAAEEGPNEYKVCDENPQGMCLKLRLTDASGGFKFVFDDLPQHLGWRARQLADALGIQPDAGGRLTIDPATLVGRDVNVEVSHYTAKSGKISATVKKYLPATPKAKAASGPRKSVAQKLTAAMPDDEIPFLWLMPFLMFFGA
jgi:hypothetical protein